jgi:hypothetical protein
MLVGLDAWSHSRKGCEGDGGLEGGKAVCEGREGGDGGSKIEGTRGRGCASGEVGFVVLDDGGRKRGISLRIQGGVGDEVGFDATIKDTAGGDGCLEKGDLGIFIEGSVGGFQDAVRFEMLGDQRTGGGGGRVKREL